MSKSEDTLFVLEGALSRILQGNPNYIGKAKKLSVRAVEQEARLGDGSAYYYPELIGKIKKEKEKLNKAKIKSPINTSSTIKGRLSNEKRLKEKYRKETIKLKAKIQNVTGKNNELIYALYRSTQKEKELLSEIVQLKRKLIVSIK